MQDNHPEWGARSPFHLCVEASGHPELRLLVEAPAELAGWVRDAARTRAAARAGSPPSWRVAPPGTGTELWPLLVSGIPGISVLTWEKSFMRTDYHTPRDTPALLDFDHLERLTRFYAYLLLRADADPERDPRPRRARPTTCAGRRGSSAARRQAPRRRGEDARGRERAARLHRGSAASCSPSTPTARSPTRTRRRRRTPRQLEAALTALDKGDRRGAAKALRGVGANALAPKLSQAAFARHAQRREPGRELRHLMGVGQPPDGRARTCGRRSPR